MLKIKKIIDILQIILKIDDIEIIKCSIESLIDNLKEEDGVKKTRRNKQDS